ncbi:MAG: hypothetical protein GXY98_05125 [Erysipelothrix sp.]|nr:hypothetical protein [Erysipelothrix sp.]
MGLFRREEKHTQEEYDEMRKKLQELNITKKEERQMIFGALRTLLPAVVLLLLAVWGVLYILITFVWVS